MAFHEGLSAAGFVDGKNVVIEYRWADSHLERVPALALDLIRRRVTVIFASGGDVTTFVAKGATATIPIVFVTGSDPVAMGFVASLNQPGGNVTGATFLGSELGPKRVQLLHELLPQAAVVGLLLNPNVPNAEAAGHLYRPLHRREWRDQRGEADAYGSNCSVKLTALHRLAGQALRLGFR